MSQIVPGIVDPEIEDPVIEDPVIVDPEIVDLEIEDQEIEALEIVDQVKIGGNPMLASAGPTTIGCQVSDLELVCLVPVCQDRGCPALVCSTQTVWRRLP